MRTTVTRILMTYFLVFVGVANVIIFDGSSGQGSDQEQVSAPKVSLSSSELNSKHSGLHHHPSHSSEGSCGDQDMCHKCHFGHCRMTIQTQQFYFANIKQVFSPSESSSVLERHLPTPFKPPIS